MTQVGILVAIGREEILGEVQGERRPLRVSSLFLYLSRSSYTSPCRLYEILGVSYKTAGYSSSTGREEILGEVQGERRYWERYRERGGTGRGTGREEVLGEVSYLSL
jgi:hypothetical protein